MNYIELWENWAAENFSGPSANILKLNGLCNCTAWMKSDIYELPCYMLRSFTHCMI